MTKKERRRYIKTYLTLTTKMRHKYKYEKFIYIHFKYFCYGIHRKELFFPWHRFYILQMENLLREIDCRVTLPYWDWSVVGENPWDKSGIWTNESYGLGGNGIESSGFCVQDGEFRQGKWHTPFFNDNLDIVTSTIDIYGDLDTKFVTPDLSDCLRRYFDGNLPNQLHVQRALSLPAERFSDFDINLRINYHDMIHNSIGMYLSIFSFFCSSTKCIGHVRQSLRVWRECEIKSIRPIFKTKMLNNQSKINSDEKIFLVKSLIIYTL